jgi:very-short-patch-repair endonuclease
MRVASAAEIEAETTRTVLLVSGRGISLGAGSADEICRAIAGEQRGRVSRDQLREARVDRHAIDRRIKNGRLIVKHPGVYVVGHTADIELGEETEALLACGPTAMLSYHSAATLWGLRQGRATPIHITVPVADFGARPKGVIVHRTILPTERCVHLDLPITSPARTMLDIAAGLPNRDVEYIIEDGLRQSMPGGQRSERLLTEAALAEVVDRAGRHPGARRLKRVLATRTGTLTESVAQRRLLDLIRDSGLPMPQTEQPLLGYRVDLLWPDVRLVVEVDGYQYHGTREAFERDRRRDARLHSAGYVVIRFTARQIEHHPLAVLAELAQAIHAAQRATARR